MVVPDYFLPDRDPPGFYPLGSYLRAPPVSVATEYMDRLTVPGDLVVDPFGALPNIARAALALNRRAIVAESNPLWAWLARALTTLPPATEIDAALARLGDTLKEELPLRAHIQQLYATICAACAQSTPADYFARTREGGLVARHYTCAHCGATRDDPATEDDFKRAAVVNARGMHYHFAFERVVPAGHLHADRIRKMLDVYTSRNLYVLATLTQKIEARFHATRERQVLLILLLHLLERGASFYATPDAEPQLTAHKQFVEFNLWREMEIAARALAEHAPALDLAESPADVVSAAAPAAFVGRGSAKTLVRAAGERSVALVLAAPPTRRVAVWALSYFWGAWILGRAAAQPLAPFLDAAKDATWEWRWYADALDESLKAIAHLLRPDARAVFVFGEAWHPVIEALMLAAAGARMQLEAFLFQPRLGDFPRRETDDIRGNYRIAFRKNGGMLDAPDGENDERELPSDAAREMYRPRVSRVERGVNIAQVEKEIRAAALAAASEILARRGEALAFSWVHHTAFVHVARQGLLERVTAQGFPYAKMKTPPGRFVHNAVMAGLRDGYAHDFDHYEGKDQFLWLRRSSELAAPLIDRVEDAVRAVSFRGAERREISEPPEEISRSARNDVEDALYRQFSGDLTPEAGLIELCAAAYVEFDAAAKTRALDALARLGERLGYKVKAEGIQNFDIVWKTNGDVAHAFVWRARAQFADLASLRIAPARGYIVVPENLVALMQEKTRRLPHVADAFHEAGWDFVRVPFVEKLLTQDKVEQSDITLMIGLSPVVAAERAQLELL
jgi:hypothetical protein